MKTFLTFLISVLLITTARVANAAVSSNSLIKLSCPSGAAVDDPCKAVYYYGSDGKRHAFPNDKVYFTWYSDFSTVQTISSSEMASFPLGTSVTYRPGVKLVKITSDPKVYAVSLGGRLRWITTEAIAIELYGTSWNTKVDDISDAFFINYASGADTTSASDYSPSAETFAAADINTDKGLSATRLDLGVTDSYDKNVNFTQASQDGIKRYNIYISWRDVEPQAGTYAFQALDETVQELKALGMRTGIEISLTDVACTSPEKPDTTCIVDYLPSDLSFSRNTSSFDNPVFVSRLTALVKALIQRYDPNVVTHVFLGNETDSYIRAVKAGNGRDLFASFQNLTQKIRDEVNKLPQPRPKFGIVYTFFGLSDPDYYEPHRKIARVVETMGFTMYPTDPDHDIAGTFQERTKIFLDAVREIAQGTPIAITEIGHPAAPPPAGANQDNQKDFAEFVIDYLRQYRSAFEFASWFSLYDNAALPDSVFTSIGLKTNQDVKRPAFDVWAKQGAP